MDYFVYIRAIDKGNLLYIRFPSAIDNMLFDALIDRGIVVEKSNSITWETMKDHNKAYEINSKKEIETFKHNKLKHLVKHES